MNSTINFKPLIKAFGPLPVIIAFLVASTVSPAAAQILRVAIAANLQPVMKVLQQEFEKKTGVRIDAVSGSSGNLTTQIKNGAPFDIFLSADSQFPEELFKSGFAVSKPVIYAKGVLILCSTSKLGHATWQQLLLSGKVSRVAIGNPAIAPYGKAAQEVLTREGIYDQLKPKLVFGESIAQVNTYITTDAVQAGFTTLSFYKENSSRLSLVSWMIDPTRYAPIKQGMVLLKRAANNAGAKKFYSYVLSPAARKIFIKYGYQVN